MKITAIRGNNLASIEGEFNINFMQEPLKSVGIFAITGKTGAGKSTILDALCLALYGKTPRTSGNEKVKIVDAGKEIDQNDARNILRRGCGAGYAEVEFEAVDNQRYRSRYSIRRASSNPNAKLQNFEIQVFRINNLNEEALSGTNTELFEHIVRLTGLTFQQFTRSVLLAQGDFATFLKAKDEERAELLEKLTGTEVYSKISMRIHINCKQAEDEYKLLNAELKSVREQILSNDMFEQKIQERDELQRNTTELEIEKKSGEAQLQWLERNDELQKTLEIATENCKKALENLTIAGTRIAFLKQYDNAQTIATQFYNTQSCTKEIQELRQSEQMKKTLLEKQQQEFMQAKQNEQQAQKNARDAQQEFEKLKPEIDKAKELDTLLIAQKQNVDAAELAHKKAKADYETASNELKAQKTLVENLQKQEIELKQWFETCEKFRSIVENSAVILQRIQIYESETNSWNANKQQLQTAREDLENTVKQHENATNELLAYSKSCSFEVLELRQQLQQGKPCPVCESIVTHIPQEETNAEFSLEELLLRSEQCQAKVKEFANQTLILHEKIKNLEKRNEDFNKLCNEQKQVLQYDLQNYPEWEKSIESGEIIPRITNLITLWKQKTEELQLLELPKAELQESNLEQRIIEKQKAENNAQNTKNEAVEKYTQLQKERSQLLKNQAIAVVEQEWNETLKQIFAIEKQTTEQKQTIEKTISSTQGELQNIIKQFTEKQAQLIQAQTEISLWLHNQNDISVADLPVLFAKSAEWIATERNEIQQLEKRKTETETTEELAKKNVTEHKKAKSDQTFTPEEQSAIIAELQEKIKLCNTRQITLQAELLKHFEAEKNLAKQSAELTKKEMKMQNWQKLSEVFGSADGKKFKKLAQAFTLNALIDDANYHLQMLSQRYRLGRIGDSLSLHVEDLDMGGEIRSVHSLSGGESFLVSLALALGLSSLTSDRLSIHSLFIDEGFGSLDIETLSCAMDALERLQATGRKIGVISHVSEMSERISCKIHVQKMGNGRSKIALLV